MKARIDTRLGILYYGLMILLLLRDKKTPRKMIGNIHISTELLNLLLLLL